MDAATILGECGGLRDTAAGWRKYVDYLGVVAEEDARRRYEMFGRLSRGWAVGSAEFKAGLKKDLAVQASGAGSFELLGADRAAQQEAREALWDERLRAAAQALGISLEALPPRKAAKEKVRLAAVMKTVTSVSNGWLADRLQMGAPGSVTQYVRRFRAAGGSEKRAFKAVLSKIQI